MDEAQGLSGDAKVVRGGLGKQGDLQRAAEKAKRLQGKYVVSACCAEGCTPEETAELAGRRLPHPEMRVASVGALREAGFAVEPDGRKPHVSIKLPEPFADDDWQRFDEQFDPPIPNPVGRT